MSAQQILQSRITQLERQLERYTDAVEQQQQALHDVYHALSDAATQQPTQRELLRLKGVVATALRAAAASGGSEKRPSTGRSGSGSGEQGWSPERDRQVHEALQDLQQRCDDGTMSSSEDVQERSAVAAERILFTVRRLLGVWLDHLGHKVGRILEEPQEKFQLFHDAPEEGTLTDFMNAFVDSKHQIASLMQAAADECRDNVAAAQHARTTATVSTVATGNPFGVSPGGSDVDVKRLEQLFAATIADAVGGACAAPNDGSKENRQHDALESNHPAPSTLQSTQRPAPSTPSRLVETATLQRQAPLTAAPVPTSSSNKPPPPIALRPLARSPGSTPPSTSAPLSSALHNAATASGNPPSSRAETPRSVSSSRRANDSSQIWSAMTGSSNTALMPQRLGPVASEQPGAEPDKLRQLHEVLRQLEFQLAGVAMNGRQTGSEAKYYALSKRLQKVRAEIAREQRELEVLQKVEDERLHLRQVKEEHRRVFHR